ncbi:MAG: hypothetical protein ACI88L_000196 [Candidatus Paceibacteria bacterium]|jgi:hypothetical protein
MKNLVNLVLVAVLSALPIISFAQSDAFFQESYVIDPDATCNVFGIDHIPVPLSDGTAFLVGSLGDQRIFVAHVDSLGGMIEHKEYESGLGLAAIDAKLSGDKLIIAIKASTFDPMTYYPAVIILNPNDLDQVVSFNYWFDEGVIPEILVGGSGLLVNRDYSVSELWDFSGQEPDKIVLPSGGTFHALDNEENSLFAYSTNEFAGIFDYDGISVVEHWYEYLSPNGLYTSNTTTPYGVGLVNPGVFEFYDASYEPNRVVLDSDNESSNTILWQELNKHPRFAFGQVRVGLVADVPLGTSMDQDFTSIWCGESTYDLKHYLSVDQGLDWIVNLSHARLSPNGKHVWVTGKLSGQYHSGSTQFFGRLPAEDYSLLNESLGTGIAVAALDDVQIFQTYEGGSLMIRGVSGYCEMFNASGKMVRKFTISDGTLEVIDVSELASGLYIMTYGENSKKLVIR